MAPKASSQSTEAFEAFWKKYPRKIGRLLAIKCYERATKQATPEEIMAGLECYIRTKPAWQEWAHPSSWLNAGRWMDEHEERRDGSDRRQESRDTPERRAYDDWRERGCPHTPRCGNFNTCQAVGSRLGR